MRANLDISDVLVILPARECPISSIFFFIAVQDPDWRLKEGLGLQRNWGATVGNFASIKVLRVKPISFESQWLLFANTADS